MYCMYCQEHDDIQEDVVWTAWAIPHFCGGFATVQDALLWSQGYNCWKSVNALGIGIILRWKATHI